MAMLKIFITGPLCGESAGHRVTSWREHVSDVDFMEDGHSLVHVTHQFF